MWVSVWLEELVRFFFGFVWGFCVFSVAQPLLLWCCAHVLVFTQHVLASERPGFIVN